MRQGIDSVEISRIEKLLEDLDEEGLRRFFTESELADAGGSANRAQKLAARFGQRKHVVSSFRKRFVSARSSRSISLLLRMAMASP